MSWLSPHIPAVIASILYRISSYDIILNHFLSFVYIFANPLFWCHHNGQLIWKIYYKQNRYEILFSVLNFIAYYNFNNWKSCLVIRWWDSDGSADFEAPAIWLPHQRVIPHRCFSRFHQFQQLRNLQTDRLLCDSCAFVWSCSVQFIWGVANMHTRDVRWWLRFFVIAYFRTAVLFPTNIWNLFLWKKLSIPLKNPAQ